MTEEEVELTELQASMPSSKGGLSYLSQTAPMETKRNVETAAKGGACIPNAIPKPAWSLRRAFSFIGLFDLLFEMPVFMIVNKLA